ncbi:Urease accessory protein ureD [Magnetospira sp. QH-2]|nr:Urease accessory protein ureD [Magnetospira sp. QH-2]
MSFAADAQGVTRLKDLYHSDPIRIVFPTPPRGEIPSAVFVTTSGGLVGGDRLELCASVGEGASALVTVQAAEKIYRSAGQDCIINVSLDCRGDAWMEWLPQETILFEGARLRRRTSVDLAPGGQLLAGELLVLGRGAMGEKITRGLVRDHWEIRRDGQLVWADALCLEDEIERVIAHPAGLGGATALGTIVYGAEDAPERLDAARALLENADRDVRGGATVVNGLLLIRLLAEDPYPLRRAYGDFWAAFRNLTGGHEAQLPRLWHI